MASPFPGMDPYLEQPAYWSSFHTKLMAEFARVVSTILPANYYVEVEARSYMEGADGEMLIGIPDAAVLKASDSITTDNEKPTVNGVGKKTGVALKRLPQTVVLPVPVEVKQRYLEVREMGSNAVITVIELLSPVNKRAGKGRDAYEEKRLSVLGSASHFVEIDLLRSYPSMPISTSTAPSDYYVLVSDAQQRPRASLYGFSIRETLPDFLLPLKGADEAIAVDLQQIFNNVYDQSRYINRIDYSKPVPAPALSAEDSNWADSILQPFRR